MTKTDLVDAVASKAGISKRDASSAVDALLSGIADALQSGEKVQLVGFGTFEVRERAARTGRNPQTGEEISIAARLVPAFKPGKVLKDAVAKETVIH